jgi:hypothetical protein
VTDEPVTDGPVTGGTTGEAANRAPQMALAWAWVGLPFAYGVYELILKVIQLFKG